MGLAEDLINTAIGSGIAGVALAMFYKLMSVEIRDLKNSIDKLTDKVSDLCNA